MPAQKKVRRAFTNKDLGRIFMGKVRFNQEILDLDYETALRWAKRTIGVIQKDNILEETGNSFPAT